MRARRGVTHSSTSGTHSVLTDITNKAQEAKLKLAIDMYLEQKEAAPACKQVKQNLLKGILDEFGIERNKFYYELNKRVIGFPNNHEISISDTHDNVHFSSEMINCSSSTKHENDTKKNGRPRETSHIGSKGETKQSPSAIWVAFVLGRPHRLHSRFKIPFATKNSPISKIKAKLT
jgi:hypothetical protein